MKKIISATFLAALAISMLLPAAGRVNASSDNHSVLKQGGMPMPGGNGGGHRTLRQGGMPMPGGNGGGHRTLRQGGMPMPGGNGGGH